MTVSQIKIENKLQYLYSMKSLVLLSLVMLSTVTVSGQKVLSAQSAYLNIGKKETVCDTIYGGLNSDYIQLFQIYIGSDNDYKRLEIHLTPEIVYSDRLKPIGKKKLICVTGLIEGTTERPFITVKDTAQLRYD